VAKLAAERFANQDKEPMGVKLGAMLIVNDLKCGKDGFTGKPLLNLGKLELPEFVWRQLEMRGAFHF
jgi:hypothetical protein